MNHWQPVTGTFGIAAVVFTYLVRRQQRRRPPPCPGCTTTRAEDGTITRFEACAYGSMCTQRGGA